MAFDGCGSKKGVDFGGCDLIRRWPSMGVVRKKGWTLVGVVLKQGDYCSKSFCRI